MINPDGSIPQYDTPGIGGAGLAGGLLGVGASIYDTYQSNKTARENTNKTIAAQRAEAEKAYQRSVEMWHMQNAYNTPQAQMQRFGAAGLNPHLIYGQGNSGNSSGTPAYQPPSIQYRYAAPAYGAAVNSLLPTLMSVGTWMQNMRASEVEIQSKETNIQKAQQLIEYLSQKNPREIQRLDNTLSLFPWQRSVAQAASQRSWLEADSLEREIRHRFGDDGMGGIRALEYSRSLSEAKLKQAQASWTDFSITNPQSLIQLVLSGAMGLAGKQLRLSTHQRSSPKRVKTFYQGGKRRSQVVDY